MAPNGTITNHHPALPIIAAPGGYLLPPIKEAQPDFHELNFKWRNQRQLRKNRRRANALGFKSAFTSAVSRNVKRSRSKYRPHVGMKQRAKGAFAYTFA